MITVILKEYLLKQARAQGVKALSLSALAREAGISKVTTNRFANNQMNRLDNNTLSSLIGALHRLGYKANVGDLVIYEEGNHEAV